MFIADSSVTYDDVENYIKIISNANSTVAPISTPHSGVIPMVSLNVDGYLLKDRLSFYYKAEEKYYMGYFEPLDLYAYGNDPMETVNELISDIVDIFEDLKGIPDNKLSKQLKKANCIWHRKLRYRVRSKEKIKSFNESEVHSALKNKIPGETITKGKHPKKRLELDGKIIKYIKFPNSHKKKVFWPRQSERIADQLRLQPFEYNDLINCPMSGTDFRKIAEERFAEA